MNAKALLSPQNLQRYVGKVQSMKKAYHIFKGPKHFTLFAFAGNLSGNFNIVPLSVVRFAQRKLARKHTITSTAFLALTKGSHFVHDRFDALAILYILVALGRVTMHTPKPPKATLVFSIGPGITLPI